MARFKRPYINVLAIALTIGLAIALFTARVQAQPSTPLSNKLPNEWQTSAAFTPPKTGNPENRQGGATRGTDVACIQGDKKLTALIPATGVASTVNPYPTFFWYLPPTSASTLEFVLTDTADEDKEIYKVRYLLASRGAASGNSSGIMSLTLPAFATLTPLTVGKEYAWRVALICNPVERSADVVAGGSIWRFQADANLATQTRGITSPQDLVAVYAKVGLWSEALTTLADLRRSRPDDPNLTAAWNKLLASVGLMTVAQEPLVLGARD